jgi:acetyltransferase-like isoleucine patch superfamily enzyme
MGGNCSVGPETFIGIGAQIMQATSIGGGTIIGMGAVVTCDIPDGVVALGCPAKVIRSNTEKKVFKNSRLSI